MPKPCRLGYEEHDGSRYCFEHYGFAHLLMFGTLTCDRKPTLDQRPHARLLPRTHPERYRAPGGTRDH